jgi:hypothetical protein
VYEGSHADNMRDRAESNPESYDHFRSPDGQERSREQMRKMGRSPDNLKRLREMTRSPENRERSRERMRKLLQRPEQQARLKSSENREQLNRGRKNRWAKYRKDKGLPPKN